MMSMQRVDFIRDAVDGTAAEMKPVEADIYIKKLAELKPVFQKGAIRFEYSGNNSRESSSALPGGEHDFEKRRSDSMRCLLWKCRICSSGHAEADDHGLLSTSTCRRIWRNSAIQKQCGQEHIWGYKENLRRIRRIHDQQCSCERYAG